MKVYIKNLTKIYEDKIVLNIDDYLFESGKIHGIIGPNGAGKSTLLKIIAGVVNSSSGIINYDEMKLNDKLLKEITYMNQKPYLLRTTVFNNIAYPLKIRKYDKKDIDKKVVEIMEELDLYKLKDQLATRLSGGEAQKVSLARAVVFEPKLLLLDEPTSSINPYSLELIEEIIKRRSKQKNMTTIMVTHNMEQKKRLCEEVLCLNKGAIE